MNPIDAAWRVLKNEFEPFAWADKAHQDILDDPELAHLFYIESSDTFPSYHEASWNKSALSDNPGSTDSHLICHRCGDFMNWEDIFHHSCPDGVFPIQITPEERNEQHPNYRSGLEDMNEWSADEVRREGASNQLKNLPPLHEDFTELHPKVRRLMELADKTNDEVMDGE